MEDYSIGDLERLCGTFDFPLRDGRAKVIVKPLNLALRLVRPILSEELSKEVEPTIFALR